MVNYLAGGLGMVIMIKEVLSGDIKLRLICKDKEGFLNAHNGRWYSENEKILRDTNLIIDIKETCPGGIGIEGIGLRITHNEFKYFDVEIVEAWEL